MYVRTQYTRSECVYISCEHRASLPYQKALIRPATIAVLSVVNVHSCVCVCVRVCMCITLPPPLASPQGTEETAGLTLKGLIKYPTLSLMHTSFS